MGAFCILLICLSCSSFFFLLINLVIQKKRKIMCYISLLLVFFLGFQPCENVSEMICFSPFAVLVVNDFMLLM
jgi:hypothetical protein